MKRRLIVAWNIASFQDWRAREKAIWRMFPRADQEPQREEERMVQLLLKVLRQK